MDSEERGLHDSLGVHACRSTGDDMGFFVNGTATTDCSYGVVFRMTKRC
jgi:hypothetical protein